MQTFVTQAFILCAGLGTRMQPLTNILPKPLLPLFQEPMIVHILRQYRKLGIRTFIINTHHLSDTWQRFFPDGSWEDCSIHFVNEPVLLDTGGGLKNIANLVDPSSPLLIHNGDIVTTLDIGRLIAKHLESGAKATLALRTNGELTNVGFDSASGLVTDMRHSLGVNPGTHEFAGIYCIQPEIIDTIPDETVISIVPTLLELIRQRQTAGIVLDDGVWFNVSSPETYLNMHDVLSGVLPAEECVKIHPSAQIAPTSSVDNRSIVGAGALIGENCVLSHCIVWPDVRVKGGTEDRDRIFFV